MEQETIIIVSVLSAAWLVVFVMSLTALIRAASLRRALAAMAPSNRMRVQKLKMSADKNHAFQSAALSPDEELSRRGYSMYAPDDLESGRGTAERQTGGQFVEELTREIDSRQHRRASPTHDQNNGNGRTNPSVNNTRSRDEPDPRQHDRQSTAPPFLLQAIEDNKRKSRLANPVANYNGSGRQSDTNPNFIY